MDTHKFDLIVIGSGPGGEGAAMKAVKAGRKVAMVERYRWVGGGCTHWATIPSKALRQAVHQYTSVRNHPLFMRRFESVQLTYPELLTTAHDVIRAQSKMRKGFYDRNHVHIFEGCGHFVDAETIEVQVVEGQAVRLQAGHIVIATGSRPYHPPEVDFSHPRIHDSDSILRLNFTPRSVTIYGAGVVGCEYASILSGLDLKVNLINTRDRLLSFLDDEITDALSYHLREQGVVIRHQEEYDSVTADESGVVLTLKSGKQIRTDILLWANGRSGNTDELNLSAAGLSANHRGQIPVNQHCQTAVPQIYAVGDVKGGLCLASAAYDEGRMTATKIMGEEGPELFTLVPQGIYTNPEISCIGKTERELTEACIPYEIGHAHFRHLARAQITGQTVGMLKLLFHRESRELLGVHCFGDQAAEIVHIGQMVMLRDAPERTIDTFIRTTFNYPTMAEAYRVAALNGINRLF